MLDSIPEDCLRDYWAEEVGRSGSFLARWRRFCQVTESQLRKGLKEVRVVRLPTMTSRRKKTFPRPMTRWWGLGRVYSVTDPLKSEEREKLI